MCFDKDDNLYVVDIGGATTSGSLIRRINNHGEISTFSGGPLNGNTANYNASWQSGLGDGTASVNGGDARFALPAGIAISEGAGNQFKLFVTEKSFVRIINEATATGIFAGNISDTMSSSGPKTGGRHDAHIKPLEGAVLFSNGTDYGSPTLYWLESGSVFRIVKQDINGNIFNTGRYISNAG